MKRIARITIIILLIGVFCLSGFKLFQMSGGYIQESLVKDKVAAYRPDAKETQEAQAFVAQNAYPHETEMIELVEPQDNHPIEPDSPVVSLAINQNIVDMQNEINTDVAGWLTIPGTHIDYPFVSTTDNDFYIGIDLYGNNSTAGTIFADQRCAADLSDFNLVLYGHNMRNNSMFGDLPLYSDVWFFENNRTGTLFLEYGTYALDIFAAMVIRSDDEIIYDPDADSEAFFGYVMENARNYREPASHDRVATLSTCGYEFNSARIVVVAALTLMQ